MEKTILSLEKLKINERMGALEIQMGRVISHLDSEKGTWERYTSHIQENLKRLEELVKQHADFLIGNSQTSGFITRLDRLEQIARAREWHLKAIWTAIVGMVLKLIYDFVNKGMR